jgi:type II secretory pathway pseudopilin PulG
VNYPGIKNIVLIIIAGLLVSGAFFFTQYSDRGGNKKSVELTVSTNDSVDSARLQELQQRDTDGDGLMDWEEVLWGTSPVNPDSDGDGKDDQDEALEIEKSGSVVTANKTTENLTLTDKFGRDIFSRYMELREAGLSSDPESQAEIVRSLIETGAFLVYPKTYTEADIVVIDKHDSETVKEYGNQIGLIFQKNTISTRSEGAIVKDSLEKNDPKILTELDPIIESYRRIEGELKLVTVPRGAVQVHIDILNSMGLAIYTAESMKKSFVDPLIALQGVGKYQEASAKIFEAIRSLQTFFALSFVTFSPSEPGAIFGQRQI